MSYVKGSGFMITSKKEASKSINLGENFKLVYQKPELFSKYYIVYYGQKYGQYYFRKSPHFLLEKAKYIDSGYFILQDAKIIGGVFIKPNFMSDLFVVPPFNDYEKIATKVLNYLKTVSNKDENILLQEIVDSHVPFYLNNGCINSTEGFWMIRPTEKMVPSIAEDYESKAILEDDKNEIGSLIESAYRSNLSFKVVESKETYIRSVENFIRNYKDNEVIYNSSRVIVNKVTKEIVGVCLNMTYEGFSLIMHLAVKPDYQGKGIGSYLLKHSINYTRTDFSAIRLYVYKNNPAMRLYEKLGFIKNGKLTDMFLI